MSKKAKKGFLRVRSASPVGSSSIAHTGSWQNFFPLPSTEEEFLESKKYYDEAMQNIMTGKATTEEQVWSEIDRLLYLEPSKWEYLLQFDPEEVGCRVWGHSCPVFWTQSGATETKEGRREGRSIPRDIMLKVVRRDNHVCQMCHQYVRDEELEFDHIIPFSKGGPTSVSNLRLLCRTCNRKKSNGLETILSE